MDACVSKLPAVGSDGFATVALGSFRSSEHDHLGVWVVTTWSLWYSHGLGSVQLRMGLLVIAHAVKMGLAGLRALCHTMVKSLESLG